MLQIFSVLHCVCGCLLVKQVNFSKPQPKPGQMSAIAVSGGGEYVWMQNVWLNAVLQTVDRHSPVFVMCLLSDAAVGRRRRTAVLIQSSDGTMLLRRLE